MNLCDMSMINTWFHIPEDAEMTCESELEHMILTYVAV